MLHKLHTVGLHTLLTVGDEPVCYSHASTLFLGFKKHGKIKQQIMLFFDNISANTQRINTNQQSLDSQRHFTPGNI